MRMRQWLMTGLAATLVLSTTACPSRQGDGAQRECVNDSDCGNSQFCDGTETCVSGQCTTGTAPCSTEQICDEANDACRTDCTDDADCGDAVFCNGTESCQPDGTCAAGTAPCAAGELCDEATSACVPEGTNVPPFASNQSAGAGPDTPTTLTLTASDANGDDLTFAVATAPVHGSLSELDNSATAQASTIYTPEAGFAGSDSFTFTVSDGAATSAPAVFSINVSASPGSYSVVLSTYLGGRGEDTIRDVAVDANGNIYVVGGTGSSDFPVTAGAYQTTFTTGGASLGDAGPLDAFVTKLDPTGQIVWSTFLGGPNYDRAYAVEVDDDGNVYVGGRAGDNFPVTSGAAQTTFGGDLNPNARYGQQDGFIAKLSADGAQLLWATYCGGNDLSFFRDIDIDDAGNVYGAMTDVSSANPHITGGAFQTAHGGGGDGVIVKLSSDGSQVIWATYLGGSGNDVGTPSLRVHTSGEVYIWGATNSSNMPTSSNAYDRTLAGGYDEFLAKLSADGRSLVFGTYLGGTAAEFTETHGLMLDPDGNAFVGATTKSTDFPTTTGAFQTAYAGSAGANTGQGTNYTGDAFVAKISANGTALLAATFLGGNGGDGLEGVGIDSEGNVYISGATYSSDFPTTSDGFQRTYGGTGDFFAVKLNGTLTSALYSTFIGGAGIDYGRSSIADPAGAFYVIGHCTSTDFPTVTAAQPNHRGGSDDGALVKFSR